MFSNFFLYLLILFSLIPLIVCVCARTHTRTHVHVCVLNLCIDLLQQFLRIFSHYFLWVSGLLDEAEISMCINMQRPMFALNFISLLIFTTSHFSFLCLAGLFYEYTFRSVFQLFSSPFSYICFVV